MVESVLTFPLNDNNKFRRKSVRTGFILKIIDLVLRKSQYGGLPPPEVIEFVQK